MPPRGPLTRFVARLLILALVAFSFPHELWASRAAFDARASNDLPEASSRRAGTVLILVPVGRCDRATTPLGRVHADHIGSVRKLTDEIGNTTDSYELTAFGELISHTGTDPQPYLFAGEPYDPNVGFAYHRARWMDPRIGRFTGMDPFEGRHYEPASLHKYLYAGQDPANKLDPTGLFIATQLTGLQINVTLRTTATVQYSASIRVVAAVLLAANIVTAVAGVATLTPGKDRGNRGHYWELFRILTSVNPIECFMSNKALGKPPTPPEIEDDFLYGGLSMWDTLSRAKSKARLLRKYRPVFGIAELWIPVGVPGIVIQKTLGTGHYTVFGPPGLVIQFWRVSHFEF